MIEGDFHWHKHDEEDEFFFVLEGELMIEVEGLEAVRLRPHEGYTVQSESVARRAHRGAR